MAIKKLSQIIFVKQQVDNATVSTSTETVEVSTSSEIPSGLAIGTIVKVPDPITGEIKQYTVTSPGQTDITQMVSVELVDMSIKSMTVSDNIKVSRNNAIDLGGEVSQLNNIYTKNIIIDGETLNTYINRVSQPVEVFTQWVTMV